MGNNTPAGTNWVLARNAYQLPHMPNAVVRMNIPWYTPVRGPGMSVGFPKFGHGGGWQFAKGWVWP